MLTYLPIEKPDDTEHKNKYKGGGGESGTAKGITYVSSGFSRIKNEVHTTCNERQFSIVLNIQYACELLVQCRFIWKPQKDVAAHQNVVKLSLFNHLVKFIKNLVSW